MFKHSELLIIAMLLFIAMVNIMDINYDYGRGSSDLHMLGEVFIVLMSLGAIVYLGWGHYRQARELEQLQGELAAGHEEVSKASEQMRAARAKYSETILTQFREWHFTRSEQEVALLLLKGLSFREIALLRNTMEKTVRQQASELYKKSGVTGRHAFSAWFFEDFIN